MTGAQYFNSVNCLLALLAVTIVTTPPALAVIDAPILTEADHTVPDFTVAFAATPVPANTKLVIFCSPPQTQGTTFCGDFRFLQAEAAASASPADVAAAMTLKWGTRSIGQRYFFRAKFVKTTTGLISGWSNIIASDVGT